MDSLTDDELEVINDLKIQAMLFDMNIDWETLELEPKRKDKQPFWVKRWQDNFKESDYTVIDNGF